MIKKKPWINQLIMQEDLKKIIMTWLLNFALTKLINNFNLTNLAMLLFLSFNCLMPPHQILIPICILW